MSEPATPISYLMPLEEKFRSVSRREIFEEIYSCPRLSKRLEDANWGVHVGTRLLAEGACDIDEVIQDAIERIEDRRKREGV